MNTPTPRKSKIESAYKEMMEDVQMSGSMIAYCMKDKALELERELTAAQEELAEWSILKGWGGTPEIINDFIKGQQTRIHYAQNIEEELTAVTEQRDRLANALDNLVNANQKWNETMMGIIGRPPNWNDSYLNEAKEALQSLTTTEP